VSLFASMSLPGTQRTRATKLLRSRGSTQSQDLLVWSACPT
jgi:hypothetical protein